MTHFSLSIMILIIFSWDGFIQWYEAVCLGPFLNRSKIRCFDWPTNHLEAQFSKTVLVALYLIYVGTMFFNEKLMTALGELEENISKK